MSLQDNLSAAHQFLIAAPDPRTMIERFEALCIEHGGNLTDTSTVEGLRHTAKLHDMTSHAETAEDAVRYWALWARDTAERLAEADSQRNETTAATDAMAGANT